MDPKKPLAEDPDEERIEHPADEADNEETTDLEKDKPVDIDQIIDRESYADRHHGRRHDQPGDISNPGAL